jgi:hypothetical protein
VAPPAVIQALLQQASDHTRALPELDPDAGPPLANIILLEGGADRGPRSAITTNHSHVLSAGALRAAIEAELMGPQACAQHCWQST